MPELMLSAQASGADSKPFLLPADVYCGATDVGQPASSGVAFGVAYVIPVLGCLSTEITFCHSSSADLTGTTFTVRLPQ